MYDITKIGCATAYATDIFNNLNGKINYMIPANKIIFGNSSMDDFCIGDTVLDIVEINIPHIYKLCNEEDGFINPAKVRGYILYSIVHELLHIDQDHLKYRDLLKQNNIYDINTEDQIIETSCHAMTFHIIKNLMEGPFWEDQPNQEKIMISTSFIPYTQDEQLQCWINSYYRVTNPADNGIYGLNDICGIDFRDYIVNQCSFALLYIYWNNVYMGGGYIYYLNTWLSPQYIFDILRPIGLVAKTLKPLNVKVTEFTKSYNDSPHILKVFEVNITMEDKTLDVVTKY